MSDVQLSNTQNIISIDVDLSNVIKNVASLANNFKKVQSLCTLYELKNPQDHTVMYCRNSLKLISSKLERLKSKISNIYNLSNNQQKFRLKRNIFPVNSYLLSWLFDVSNSNDAESNKKPNDSFLKNKIKTLSLMRQQLGIISNAITHIDTNIC